MVLDVSLVKIFSFLGHDGSEILYPEYEEPFNRRSFHPQELIDFCYSEQRSVITIEEYGLVGDGKNCCITCKTPAQFKIEFSPERLQNYLLLEDGVLAGETDTGKRHAVAWVDNRIYDPNGTSYDLDKFKTEVFFIIKLN